LKSAYGVEPSDRWTKNLRHVFRQLFVVV
jgi:hypothetical protein